MESGPGDTIEFGVSGTITLIRVRRRQAVLW
jgi:hypothetical protein